jgi:recombination protein RecA
VEQEIVKKSGAWYTYEGEQLGQGKENSRKFLIDNPEIANEIEKKIKTKLGIGVPRAVADLPVEDDLVIDDVIEVAPKVANA